MAAVLKFALFAIIFIVVIETLTVLPHVDIDKDAVMSSSAWSWVKAALYFIPTHTVGAILIVVGGAGIWSLIVAVVKTIWDVLPFS